MYIKPTNQQVKNGMECGWKKEDAERGFAIFDFNGTGMLDIEVINDIYYSTNSRDDIPTDEDCAYEAERLGICKIIPIEELPENFEFKCRVWIDTAENREQIKKYADSKSNK